MRKVLWVGLVLAAAYIGYWAWALAGAASLAEAAAGGDPAVVMARVDLPALRKSFAHQIVASYLRQNPRFNKLNSLGRSFAGGAGVSIADELLGEILTPENVVALLKQGTPIHGPAASLIQLPNSSHLLGSSKLSVVFSSYFDGLTDFVAWVGETDDQYGVHLRLSRSTWQLSGVDLPKAVVDRLAQEVIERQKKAA